MKRTLFLFQCKSVKVCGEISYCLLDKQAVACPRPQNSSIKEYRGHGERRRIPDLGHTQLRLGEPCRRPGQSDRCVFLPGIKPRFPSLLPLATLTELSRILKVIN